MGLVIIANIGLLYSFHHILGSLEGWILIFPLSAMGSWTACIWSSRLSRTGWLYCYQMLPRLPTSNSFHDILIHRRLHRGHHTCEGHKLDLYTTTKPFPIQIFAQPKTIFSFNAPCTQHILCADISKSVLTALPHIGKQSNKGQIN